ncbi:MAG: ABC transporter ATP-binding protein, partial [Microvirga sp.]
RVKPKALIDRMVDEALNLVRLRGQENKLPGQLSGGQQQRVAIARAIVIEPPLVLMDEPLSNLDAKLRLEMRAEIRRIHNELGATTIYVTHDQDEALSLADRIVVLRDGVVRQVGTPKELYDAPAHLDVADFMGFRNKLQGKVVGSDGSRVVLDVEGARISGIARESLSTGAAAYAAVRPDDLMVGEAGQNAIAATVDTIEYRGREFVGTAHSAGGLDFVFRSHQPVEPGSSVHLRADDQRVLVFAEPIQGRH